MKLPLSVVIIAKDEQTHIEDCIRSVPFASEVLVVDSGSSDQTVSLAKALGARVEQREWQGFGPQKNWAVSVATYDWVLCLDADERVSEELAEELVEKFEFLQADTLYRLPRVSYYMHQWIWHGGWFPDFQGRLFNRQHFQWDQAPIHERVVGGAKSGHFVGPLEHLVFDSLKDHVLTNLRYSHILADQDDGLKKRFFSWQIVTRPFGKFVECYLIKQGFRDGWPGFIIAISAAYSMFLRMVRRYEKRLSKS